MEGQDADSSIYFTDPDYLKGNVTNQVAGEIPDLTLWISVIHSICTDFFFFFKEKDITNEAYMFKNLDLDLLMYGLSQMLRI